MKIYIEFFCFFFSLCNHWSTCIGVVRVGYVCSLVQWQFLCIYLNGWDFFFFHIPIPLYSIIVNIKQMYTN